MRTESAGQGARPPGGGNGVVGVMLVALGTGMTMSGRVGSR
jgi:hypothetical protein